MTPRFPILWLTVLTFGIVAAATQNVLDGGVIFAIVLPAVLALQWCIRWLLRRQRAPVWLRRGIMALPALLIAANIYNETNNFGGRQTAPVRVAFAGHAPTGLKDLHVKEEAWTDYVVFAYFRCDPESLRSILEKPPFARCDLTQDVAHSFADTPFPDLRALPDVPSAITFERTDLDGLKGSCTVITDSAFSFAYVTYAVD